MKLSETRGLDPNRLPYFVTDAAGNRVPVMFAALTEADNAKLSGEDWAGALFLEAWRQYVANGEARSLKIVGRDTLLPPLGLLRLGSVATGGSSLRYGLLETCPVFRHGLAMPMPSLRGIGKVLVARLIVESYNQGAGGAVFVVSHRNARNFYERIGFIRSASVTDGYRLVGEAAAEQFEKVTI